MVSKLRSLTKKILAGLNILAVSLFVLACSSAFFDPSRYWIIGILGVGLPLLAIIVLLFALFWILLRSRWAFLSLAALLAGSPQVLRILALHPGRDFPVVPPAGAIRVMQWNVSLLDQAYLKRPGGNYRLRILDFIRRQNPDILCMEEFLQPYPVSRFPENIRYISENLHFPYHYFSRDYDWSTIRCQAGVVIFSRYPILDSFQVRYNNMKPRGRGESLAAVDIDVNGKRIRVFATHLQSLHFGKEDYSVVHSLVHAEPDAVTKSRGVLRKFREAYPFRSRQAGIVRHELDASPWPVILCGDFNDIPNSFAYSGIIGDRQDAFLKGGFGLGRSFNSLSPTLRIDYILADKSMEVLNFRRSLLPYSDHYPLETDLRITQAR
jgi:endonuclease/exonuclease/phosphatase family metal-dependent hydrolase